MRLLIHDYAGHPFQAELSRELARRGHTVTHAFAGGLLTPRGALEVTARDPASFSVVEIPMLPGYRENKYSFIRRRHFEAAYGHAFASLVESLKPEVVLSGNTPTEAQWTMIKAARGRGVPVVTWIQDFYGLAVDRLVRKKHPVLGRLAGWWYRRLDALCYQRSAQIVAITEDFVPVLAEMGVSRDRVTMIPNWAPLNELPQRPRRNPWSACQGLDQAFVFQYSGTLAMKHNPEILFRLAQRFRDDPLVRVVVITEGPGADYLRKRQASVDLPNLLILPFQRYDQLPDVLATSDVLIAILEEDAGIFSVPSKVLSYHCAGRSLLASIPENNLAARMIHEANSGICLPPRELDRFLNAADLLRKDDITRNEMAARARNFANREFNIKAIGDRFEVVLNKAMSDSAPADQVSGRHEKNRNRVSSVA